MKISLLGDSIRLIGYGKKISEYLDGAEIFQPTDNCRFAKYTLRGLFDWHEQLAGSDVIHWNNGLWDNCVLFPDGEPFTPIDEYVENIVRIASILLSITPNVIFATTTPVRETNRYNKNSLIDEYNKRAVEALLPMGVVINDLGAAVSTDINRYIREDDSIHLTDEGITLCASLVAEKIKSLTK